MDVHHAACAYLQSGSYYVSRKVFGTLKGSASNFLVLLLEAAKLVHIYALSCLDTPCPSKTPQSRSYFPAILEVAATLPATMAAYSPPASCTKVSTGDVKRWQNRHVHSLCGMLLYMLHA